MYTLSRLSLLTPTFYRLLSAQGLHHSTPCHSCRAFRSSTQHTQLPKKSYTPADKEHPSGKDGARSASPDCSVSGGRDSAPQPRKLNPLDAHNREVKRQRSVSLPAPSLVDGVTAADLEWKEVRFPRFQEAPLLYLQLAKSRLTAMVVITAMSGYALAPAEFSLATFLCMSLGTALTSAAANSSNQYLEVPYDSQMLRTKNRVLVRGIITPGHALVFSWLSGLAGVALLYTTVNPLCAGLGLFNYILYSYIYTPMKRYSILNTWVGSLVGAIPPVMGYVGCTGSIDAGAGILAGLLYMWQFPHFNALSWNLRKEYSRAGYRMMCVTHPALCKRVTVRYSLGLLALCNAAPMLDVTSWAFAVDSLPLNLYMIYLSCKFYKEGDASSARKLFRFSLIYLPVIMAFLLIAKKPPPSKHSDQTHPDRGTLRQNFAYLRGRQGDKSGPTNHDV